MRVADRIGQLHLLAMLERLHGILDDLCIQRVRHFVAAFAVVITRIAATVGLLRVALLGPLKLRLDPRERFGRAPFLLLAE